MEDVSGYEGGSTVLAYKGVSISCQKERSIVSRESVSLGWIDLARRIPERSAL
jgi:hypothetical protein